MNAITCASCHSSIPADADFCPECGARVGEAPAMTLGAMETLGSAETRVRGEGAGALEPGTLFAGRYEVLGMLGSGGMGAVHRVQDQVAGREVALKLIRPGRTTSDAEIARLIAEGVTARDIRHPAVVAVYDVGEDGGQPYLTMEVVEGTPMRDWLRERLGEAEDVPVDAALAIGRTLARGLAAAHAAGVVHRDLKPENVILTAEPTGKDAALKILDFGIARVAAADAETPGTGSGDQSIGTPRYMAPEQVTSAALAGPPADVYSLGVMLYEMLVGVLPQGHWQPPSGGRSDVPESLDRFVYACLSNRPGDRPPDMDAVLRALDAIGQEAAGRRPAPHRPRPAPGPGPTPQPHPGPGVPTAVRSAVPWVLIAVVAGFVSLLGIGVALGLAAGGDDPEPGPFVPDPEPWVVPDPGPDPGPEPDPDLPEGLEVYSGTWIDVAGHTFDVTVRKSGRFRGKGRMADGSPATIRGNIDGELGTLTGSMNVSSRRYAEFTGGWNGIDRFFVSLQTVDGGLYPTEFIPGP